MLVPRPGVALDLDRPARFTDDALHRRQTQPVPCPGFLVVKKGSNSRARVSASIPQPLSFTISETARRRSPGSALRGNFTRQFRGPRAQPDRSALRHGIARVQHQVQQDLPQLRRIGQYPSGAGVERRVEDRVQNWVEDYDQFNLFADQPLQQIFRWKPQLR